VALITSLAPPARDHYPMKGGLDAQELEETGALYPAGTALGHKLGDFIVDFLANFSHVVTARDLQWRDGVGELDQILDTVEENL
jgi:hypothetical protein